MDILTGVQNQYPHHALWFGNVSAGMSLPCGFLQVHQNMTNKTLKYLQVGVFT